MRANPQIIKPIEFPVCSTCPMIENATRTRRNTTPKFRCGPANMILQGHYDAARASFESGRLVNPLLDHERSISLTAEGLDVIGLPLQPNIEEPVIPGNCPHIKDFTEWGIDRYMNLSWKERLLTIVDPLLCSGCLALTYPSGGVCKLDDFAMPSLVSMPSPKCRLKISDCEGRCKAMNAMFGKRVCALSQTLLRVGIEAGQQTAGVIQATQTCPNMAVFTEAKIIKDQMQLRLF